MRNVNTISIAMCAMIVFCHLVSTTVMQRRYCFISQRHLLALLLSNVRFISVVTYTRIKGSFSQKPKLSGWKLKMSHFTHDYIVQDHEFHVELFMERILVVSVWMCIRCRWRRFSKCIKKMHLNLDKGNEYFQHVSTSSSTTDKIITKPSGGAPTNNNISFILVILCIFESKITCFVEHMILIIWIKEIIFFDETWQKTTLLYV